MTTFSQLVDALIGETLRPDLRLAFEQFINLTCLELHQGKDSGEAILYGENRKEAVVTAELGSESVIWDIPRPATFQSLESVWYPQRGVTPKQRNPSMAMALQREVDGFAYYYRTGPSFAFFGSGGVGTNVYLSWFERTPRLSYVAKANRLVSWDENNQDWIWDPSVQTSEKPAILEKHTHWLLTRWQDVVNAGAKAKAYVRVGDEARARLHYSLYTNLRDGLRNTEAFDATPSLSR